MTSGGPPELGTRRLAHEPVLLGVPGGTGGYGTGAAYAGHDGRIIAATPRENDTNDAKYATSAVISAAAA